MSSQDTMYEASKETEMLFRNKRRFLKPFCCAIALPLLILFVFVGERGHWSSHRKRTKKICGRMIDGKTVCRPDCSHLKGHFGLPGMKECHKLLTCDDNVHTIEPIKSGGTKWIYKGRWKNFQIALNVVKKPEFLHDFRLNIRRLKELRSSSMVTQLIGVCDHTFITEYYRLGSAELFENALSRTKAKGADDSSSRRRFSLCLDYVKIIDYLHHSPVGTLTMCDSNSVNKTLSQFLVSDNLRLVLNDVDCVLSVGKKGIVCNGNSRISGTLLAPEQRWPYKTKEFDRKLMPRYDESIDVYRIPFVCDRILGGDGGKKSDEIKRLLRDVHDKCKRKNAKTRPKSRYVLKQYYKVKRMLRSNK